MLEQQAKQNFYGNTNVAHFSKNLQVERSLKSETLFRILASINTDKYKSDTVCKYRFYTATCIKLLHCNIKYKYSVMLNRDDNLDYI
jgi:hypothetical protein